VFRAGRAWIAENVPAFFFVGERAQLPTGRQDRARDPP
jgi:hypothetical protein